jgi:hypothetical protein
MASAYVSNFSQISLNPEGRGGEGRGGEGRGGEGERGMDIKTTSELGLQGKQGVPVQEGCRPAPYHPPRPVQQGI